MNLRDQVGVSISTIVVLLALQCPSYAGIIGYWRFEEGVGTVAVDQTGLFNGQLISFEDSIYEGWSSDVFAAMIPYTGQANTGSILMQGGSEFIDFSNGQDMYLGTNFTVEFFMKPDQPVIASPIFGLSPVSSVYFLLGVDNSELVFRASFQGQIGSLVPATMVQLGQWQHVALVKQPGIYSIYVNGLLQHSAPLAPTLDGPFWFPGTATTGDRIIGGDSGSFRGYLDEFRISDTALTPDQFLIVPEPGTLTLMLLGAGALAAWKSSNRWTS